MKVRSLIALFLVGICSAADPVVLEQRIRLLDDDGSALAGIPIHASSVVGWKPGRDFGTDLKATSVHVTDKDGYATIKHPKGNGRVEFWIKGDSRVYGQRWESSSLSAGSETIIVFAKSVKNPTAMYVMQVGFSVGLERNLPVKGQLCGFDLLRADWLPPYGRGETADIHVRLVESVKVVSSREPFDLQVDMDFTGIDDGIVEAGSREPGPTLMPLQRFAPLDGYRRSIQLRMWRTAEASIKTTFGKVDDQNTGFFFRIRSKRDAAGKMVAARYGKILGAIEFAPRQDGTTFLRFWYFLSGSENDRNMENRLDMNLFWDLDSSGRNRLH